MIEDCWKAEITNAKENDNKKLSFWKNVKKTSNLLFISNIKSFWIKNKLEIASELNQKSHEAGSSSFLRPVKKLSESCNTSSSKIFR